MLWQFLSKSKTTYPEYSTSRDVMISLKFLEGTWALQELEKGRATSAQCWVSAGETALLLGPWTPVMDLTVQTIQS